MQAQVVTRYSLNGPLTHIVALPNNRAVALSNWGRSLFIFADGVVRHIHLNEKEKILPRQRRGWPDHWPANEEEGEFFFPSTLDNGAPFAYRRGVGIVYDNAVYLLSDIEKPALKLPITKPLPPHPRHKHLTRNPLVASAIPNSPQVIVDLSDFHTPQHGLQLGTLTLGPKNASWSEPLLQANFDELEAIIQPDPQRYHPKGHVPWSQHIGSVLVLNDQEIFITAVRAYMLSSSSHCAYSALAKVGESGDAKLIQELPIGRAFFAADKQTLLVYTHQNGEAPQLLFYDTQANYLDTLALTPALLGDIPTFDLLFDRNGDDLWIANAFRGYVAHTRLRSAERV